jgi:hypothetical protein
MVHYSTVPESNSRSCTLIHSSRSYSDNNGSSFVANDKIRLGNDNITLKNKIVFTAILIFLVAVIAYLIQQHYYNSFREGLMPVDLLTQIVTSIVLNFLYLIKL